MRTFQTFYRLDPENEKETGGTVVLTQYSDEKPIVNLVVMDGNTSAVLRLTPQELMDLGRAASKEAHKQYFTMPGKAGAAEV